MRFDLMSLLLDSAGSGSASSYNNSLRSVVPKQDPCDFDISLELNPFGPVDLA
jgi:hypothetical protein